MVVSLYVKTFKNKLSLKLVFLNPFVMLQFCNKFLEVKNVLKSTIALFKCTSISQHNESLEC